MDGNITTPEEVQAALDIARQLIRAGVPVFAAEPGDSPGTYKLPKHWEKTVPSETWLEKYQPGWGLAAVGGHRADFLDSDPRNGGEHSVARLQEEGDFPLTFGHQATPSGGDHWVIAPTGERKSTGFMPGLDLQSGAEDGQGRGFVWIAPTVRRSKDPADQGQLRAYRWVEPPDMVLLEEQLEDGQDSVRGIATRIQEKRSAPRERAPQPDVDAHQVADPFMDASMAGAGGFGGDRSFTLAEAQDFVRPGLLRLQEAKVGLIEETANTAAATLSHFVPAFWSVDEAMDLLTRSLAETAYDPNGPSDWTAEKFRLVLDGRRPPLDNWKASRKAEPPMPPAAVVEAAPGEEALTTLERLRRKLVSAADLANSPTPEPLIHGLLDLATEAWLIGAPGSLKSFVALDLAGHVGRGAAWQDHPVERRDVLYIAAEGERGMVLRTRAWMKTHGDMEGVTFLPYPVQVRSNDGQWEALVHLAGELKPGLIVIDTQARVSVGLEENSATDMGVLVDAVGRLKRATGACVLVIHHTGRNGGDARGSSALDGAQDTELKVVRAEPRSSLQCKIIQDKQKDMAEGDREGIALQLQVVDLGTDERTGRELSSLVVRAEVDPFLDAQGIQEVDVEPWKGKHPEPWTGEKVAPQAKVKRRILQVLADHAGTTGLTEATVRRVVKDRWEEPSATGWTDAWQSVKDLTDLVMNVGGERWAVDQAALAGLRERAPE